jgi:hypothetical protein
MIQEFNLATWEEFVSKINEIRSGEQPTKQPLLFRGQSDSGWALKTSLDRYNQEGMLFSDYY